MSKIAIIVPCYNESRRLAISSFENFLKQQSDASIYFVNDGSKDNTVELIKQLQTTCPAQVHLVNMPANKGKASAVREGMLAATKTSNHNYIGYIDADLSTSLEEFMRLYSIQAEANTDYVFGSRIKMLNNKIERSGLRHIMGRLIATLIDNKFRLGIYDTQCGAKCFKGEMIPVFCEKPFKTKWLFDIEIFLRIQTLLPGLRGIEVPLKQWINTRNSKINILSVPSVVGQLFTILFHYRKP